ncbi:MAG TPA: serine/threonine-protein kinase [Myxococcaceae bacterium]|nr:serine/threonine-protein kinase [Myxococcaceae bacterium]
MSAMVRYHPLGPLLAGDGSRAFLGLEIEEDGQARPVVLVWVPEEVANDAKALARLHKDTEVAAKLNHPNLIRVFGLESLEGGLARVVEFVNGESLRRVLQVAKKLPPPLAALIVADAALGVQHAHLAGNEDGSPLVHGELRPETLLVAFTGVCKVTGYGALPVAPRESGGQRVPGRRSHSAPEQILGGRAATDRQTDVYLLGLTLFECMTGSIPFADQLDFERAIFNRPLSVPSNQEIPAPLFRVIKRAMSKKASERYATPLAFREAVEQAMGTLPTHQDLATFLQRLFPEDNPARYARRKEIEAGISGAAFLTPRPSFIPSGVEGPPSEAESKPPTSQGVQHKSWIPLATLIGAMAIAGGALYFRSPSSPPSSAPVRPPEPTAIVTPNREPPVGREDPLDSGNQMERAAGAADASLPQESEPTPRLAEGTGLLLNVEPAVDVSIEGRPLGKSPIDIPLPPGRHMLSLSDKERGIRVSRRVRVGSKGKTSVQLSIGQGSVEITAPAGAAIVLDGKSIGKAPLGKLQVFEGSHHVQVNFEGAKWRRDFSVRSGEHLTFNVQTTPP